MTEELLRRFFPRTPVGPQGPERGRWLAASADGRPVGETLAALSLESGFATAANPPFLGTAEQTRALFEQRLAEGRSASQSPVIGLFSPGDADTAECADVSVCEGADGERALVILRSERAENLLTLARLQGLLRFERVRP